MLDILRQPHSCCHSWRMLKVQHRTGGRPLAKGCVCMPVGLSGDGIKLAHLHFLVNQQTPGMFRWRDNHFFSTWPLLVYKCRSHQFNSKSSLFGGNPMIKKEEALLIWHWHHWHKAGVPVPILCHPRVNKQWHMADQCGQPPLTTSPSKIA